MNKRPADAYKFNKNIQVRLSKKFLDSPRGQSESLLARFPAELLREKAVFLEGIRLSETKTPQYNLLVQFSTGQTLAGLDMDDLEWLPE